MCGLWLVIAAAGNLDENRGPREMACRGLDVTSFVQCDTTQEQSASPGRKSTRKKLNLTVHAGSEKRRSGPLNHDSTT